MSFFSAGAEPAIEDRGLTRLLVRAMRPPASPGPDCARTWPLMTVTTSYPGLPLLAHLLHISHRRLQLAHPASTVMTPPCPIDMAGASRQP